MDSHGIKTMQQRLKTYETKTYKTYVTSNNFAIDPILKPKNTFFTTVETT